MERVTPDDPAVREMGVHHIASSTGTRTNSSLSWQKLKLSNTLTLMWFVRRCFRGPPRFTPHRAVHKQSSSSFAFNDTDSCGIPVRPTWSVLTLLSSYPKPTVSSATLSRLHELSALIPPADGTQEHTSLKRDVEDLVRLVEAVKLVDTKDVYITGACEGQSAHHLDDVRPLPEIVGQGTSGGTLLDCASRTLDGFYVVDGDRKRS